MEVRAENPEDVSAVRNVNLAAFGRENEADLVDKLRDLAATFSFVAVESKQIFGHACFSPVEIAGDCPHNLTIFGLAPVAVLPEQQRQGIGTLLIRQSLATCAQLGCQAVVVLGDPNYYSRFGFISAKAKGLRSEYAVPDEAFMVLELAGDALKECSGIVKYHSEFKECV
jgi:putative acetyltransferase